MDTVTDWSDDELREARSSLIAMAVELESSIAAVGDERRDVLDESCLDEGDQAFRQLSLDREETQVAHARAVLDQTRHVVQRLDDGLYGICEGCGARIPRERLEAFPRATTCTTCARVVTPN